MAWVELSILGYATRIFKNEKQALTAEGLVNPPPIEIPYHLAIKQIRQQVWNRQNGLCLRCPNLITWAGFHLHEKIHRGQGGEVSLDNSYGLCASCHIGLRGAHKNRFPQFTKGSDKIDG
jgi:hypothetical protein